MTPRRDDEAEQAAAQMAHATDRLREQARGLGARAKAADEDDDVGASFSTTTYQGFPVLVVAGQVDVRTAARMRRHLLDLLDAGHVDVIIDMTTVEFMDSSGLNVLVGALRAVRPSGGTLRVVAGSRHLKQLFEITGVHKILPLHATLAAAVG
jgi:anti-sigma B factor antagonist